MADDIDRDDLPNRAASAPPPPPATHRGRRWAIRILTIVVLVPVLVLVIWTAVALNYSYSRGYRSGYIQKFSRKGWLCKTWEGELAIVNVPGSQPEIFRFSVRNDSVAGLLQRAMGDRVTLAYEQHTGIPTACFGETEYFVDSLKAIVEPGATPTPPVPPAPVIR